MMSCAPAIGSIRDLGMRCAKLHLVYERRNCPRCSLLKQIAAVFLVFTFLPPQTNGPERKVEGNVISSQHDPNVGIELPKSVQYVGADRWLLYGIADCELHAFVEADGKKNVQRLYWVQFEGYVPTKPELKHKYDSPRHATMGGLDFYVDTWVRLKDAETQKGSDREHIEALIRAKGYKMPEGMMNVRLVHLLDEQKRKELMVIYGEDVSQTGFNASDLSEGGRAFSRRTAIENALIERAKSRITIRVPNDR